MLPVVLSAVVKLPGWEMLAGPVAAGVGLGEAAPGLLAAASGLFVAAPGLVGSGLLDAAPIGDGSRGARAWIAAISACEGL